jgi:hypothetical protein
MVRKRSQPIPSSSPAFSDVAVDYKMSHLSQDPVNVAPPQGRALEKGFIYISLWLPYSKGSLQRTFGQKLWNSRVGIAQVTFASIKTKPVRLGLIAFSKGFRSKVYYNRLPGLRLRRSLVRGRHGAP